jgi:ribosomal protein S18 acetylase RimI-like enzyme
MGTTVAGTAPFSKGNPGPDAIGVTRQVFRLGAQRAVLEIRRTSEGPQALILPGVDAETLSAALLRIVTDSVDEQIGSQVRMRSTALTEDGAACFTASGFVVQRRLHLLVLDLSASRRPQTRKRPVGVRLRRVSLRRRAALLEVDHAAFDHDLRLDAEALSSALRATPVARLRCAVTTQSPVGYAIFGRAGQRGYLQRLAVHPHAQRVGIGRALLVDGLRWSSRRGIERIIVNTEYGNDPALHLYRSVGFVDAPLGLVIMERPPPTTEAAR